MQKILVYCASLIILFSISSSQHKYKKKVISYINTLLVDPKSGLTADQRNIILSTLKKSVAFKRFNYMPLPDSIIEQFTTEYFHQSEYSGNTIQSVVEKTVAPALISLLDLNKELLSKENLSEEERNTFLATKANAAGLSATQLEGILNSGYFYIPFVEYYNRTEKRGEREEKDQEGKVTGKVQFTEYIHTMEIGLLWYAVQFDEKNTPSVGFVSAANGWAGSAISRSKTSDGGIQIYGIQLFGGNPDEDAFTNAVEASGRNVEIETKKIDAFKIIGDITEVTPFGINFPLGTREGIRLDDSFWVEEKTETQTGEIIKERRGFVKVREIGDNENDESAFSFAQVITGSNYSPGLTVSEIPLIPINGIVGIGFLPNSISAFQKGMNGSLVNSPQLLGLSKYDFAISIPSEINVTAAALAFAFQLDIANLTKVSELWLEAGAAIGTFETKGKFFFPNYLSSGSTVEGSWRDSADIRGSTRGNLYLGVMKKIYFHRFGLILEGNYKVSLLGFSATGKDHDGKELKYSLNNSSFGFGGKVGLEVYITPTLSIGSGIELSGTPSRKVWQAAVEDKDKKETKFDIKNGPSVGYSGIGLLTWINYSLPAFF